MASLADCASGCRELCVECSKKRCTTTKALIYLEETCEKNPTCVGWRGTENKNENKDKKGGRKIIPGTEQVHSPYSYIPSLVRELER